MFLYTDWEMLNRQRTLYGNREYIYVLMIGVIADCGIYGEIVGKS